MKEWMNPTHEEYCDGIDSIGWVLRNLREQINITRKKLMELQQEEKKILDDLEKLKLAIHS